MRNVDGYPKSLAWAARDANLTLDQEYLRSIREYRCSPIRLLDYINRQANARDALDLYDMSDGYTKTVSLGFCGFVANPKE